MNGIKGWLLVFVLCSVPVQLFNAAGLAGWFFDYPLPLFGVLFVILAAPLVLLILRHRAAPKWNIIMLWVGALLITVRIFYGLIVTQGDALTRSEAAALGAIIAASLAWATAWTLYFRRSRLVAGLWE